MAEVKKVTLGGPDNYPKAKRVAGSKTPVARPRTQAKPSPSAEAPRDTFQRTNPEVWVDDQKKLRQQAMQRKVNADIRPDYPTSGKLSRRQSSPATGAATEKAVKARPEVRVPEAAPPRTSKPTSGGQIDLSPTYPTSGTSSAPMEPPKFKPKYTEYNAVVDATRKKWNAANAEAEMKAKAAQGPPPKARKGPKISQSTKLGASGAMSAAGGLVTLKNGVQNLAHGNYTEGGLQVAQGGVAVADGVNDLNAARKGLNAAPAGNLTKGLKIGGAVLNGAGAAVDVGQAAQAFQKGNAVQGSEELASATINAVSAFPPTAVIGAIGGVADWAMQASGADEAMVRALTKGQDEAYVKRMEQDMRLAEKLVRTNTTRLSQCTKQEKRQYIRGIQGLKEYRRIFAAQGKTQAVRDIDAHIARIKGAWQ